MAGHSHWANIQHKKAAKDVKKGKILSKLVKLIYTAVKEGGSGKPEENPRLRIILDKCRLANMPKDNIKRAIEKASGGEQGYEGMTFEAYGAGGVALVIDCMTDNTGRTGPEIRNILDKNGAKIGKQGSVSHMFLRKGIYHIEKDKAPEEKLMEVALDAGAEDVVDQDSFWEVVTAPTEFVKVGEAFEKAGIITIKSEILMVPQNRIEVDSETARKLMAIIEKLEEHDDVQNVFSNFDITADVAAELAKDA